MLEIESLEKELASFRTSNIQLEQQTQMSMEQTNVNIYSDQEIAKLESEARGLEEKNARMRDILTKMGISVLGIETG